MRRIGLIGALVALGIAGGALVSQRAGGDSPRGNSSLVEARAFTEYPLYNAGDEVAGQPLTYVLEQPAANRAPADTGSVTVSFMYGDCIAAEDEGCAPPIEIQNWPACVRNLSLYENQGEFGPTPRETIVRGAPAALFEDGKRIEVQTGTTTVVVFGRSESEMVAAADALRGVNNGVSEADPLPAPAPGAIGGALACD